jgi:hypothetical protein
MFHAMARALHSFPAVTWIRLWWVHAKSTCASTSV